MNDQEFEFRPHEDLEAYVRQQLDSMRQRPRMYASQRGEFLERVATMLELVGVHGRTLVHLAHKQGCALVGFNTELTDKEAHETIDEALAILDGVKANGKIERPRFRYKP